jgi:DNA-binding MarR family transcriptional regulator
MKHGDLKLEIMRILLNQDEDISVRGIARRLDLPSSHIFYHLKKMVEMGILTKNRVEDKMFYTPQKMFTSDIEKTTKKINEISVNIDESDPTKLSNCLAMFLRCYPSLEN